MPIFSFGFIVPEKEHQSSWWRKLTLDPALVKELFEAGEGQEGFILKSGRTLEVFAACEKREAFVAGFWDSLVKKASVPRRVVEQNRFRYDGAEAIAEFFRMAVGLDEARDISKQVAVFRECFTVARDGGLVGPLFSKLFQRGLWLSEKARIEHNLQKSAFTHELVVAELAQKLFGASQEKKALVAARTFECEDFVRALVAHGTSELLFLELQDWSARDLHEHFGGKRVASAGLADALARVDMALIFEQEVEEALTELPMAKIMSQRKNRPLLCVSYFEPVAEQRNQKQDLSRFYNLYYYKKADLDQIVADNLRTHRQNTDTINQLIEKEVEDFVTWVHAKEPYRFGNIIGKSREMQRILELVARIAQTDISVIIDGESGTGKELIARAIHEHSRRAQNPFVVVNCGAIPEGLLESELFGHVRGAFTGATVNRKGLFEVANHGTIFLDEIGETSLTMQVKLLRFLQEGEIKPVGSTQTLHVDVRLLAATNRNLEKMVEEGTFRQDLYYRLNVIRLTIPPLSERPEDILPIAEFFIKKYAARIHKTVLGLDESARQVLTGYTWPGNVRELENAIERAVALASGPYLTREDFPAAMGNGHVAAVPQDGVKALSLKEVERRHIAAVLRQFDWNYDLVTKILGIGRTTLWRKMREYNISPDA